MDYDGPLTPPLPMISQPSIGIILHEQRAQSEQTLRAVSRRAKISHSHLQKIESGKIRPTLSTLLRLLEACDAQKNLLMKIFDVPESIEKKNDHLAKAMVALIFTEADVNFDTPTPQKDSPDFTLDLGQGLYVVVDVKSCFWKAGIKTRR
jgi:transcriptional regulator with XRE-family HTH domain